MVACYIALGGNVGDVVAAMEEALRRLERGPGLDVARVSRAYRTQPVGDAAGTAFLNAAARLNVRGLTPQEVLRRLQRIEAELGRQKSGHWTPRPIDLDLILWGEAVIRSAELYVPHPAAWYRRFVLDPLSEIAADAVHPVLGESISRLREQLCVRPLTLAVTGGSEAEWQQAVRCARGFPSVSVWEDIRGLADLTQEPVLILSLGRADADRVSGPEGTIAPKRIVPVAELPGDVERRVRGVLTAALDEPVLHSRPLLKMP